MTTTEMKVHKESIRQLNPFQINYLTGTMERSHLFKKVNIQPDNIEYTLRSEIDALKAGKTINKLLDVCYNLKQEILYKTDYSSAESSNPMDYLINSKQVIPMGNGTFIFQGEFLRLMKFIDKYFFTFAKTLGGIEQQYPVLWPIDLFRRIDYLKDFPQNILLVSGVKKDHKSLETIATKYDSKHDFKSIKVDGNFDECCNALGPSTCDPCYYVLKDKVQEGNNIYTALSKSFRNEVSPTDDLDRLPEFSIREIITVGSMDYVMEIRQKYIDFCINFLEFAQLDAKIEIANDPFFTTDSILKNAYQNSVNSKYEILAKLNRTDTDLAIGSINWHGDFFGRAFDVTNKDSQYIYSSCLGFGIERVIFAFLSQYGNESHKWPKQFYYKYCEFIETDEALNNLFAIDDDNPKSNYTPVVSADTHGLSEHQVHNHRTNNRDDLLEIFHEIFDIQMPPDQITRDQIGSWDSLNHMRLIFAIENKYSVKVESSMISELHKDFETIYNFLEDP